MIPGHNIPTKKRTRPHRLSSFFFPRRIVSSCLLTAAIWDRYGFADSSWVRYRGRTASRIRTQAGSVQGLCRSIFRTKRFTGAPCFCSGKGTKRKGISSTRSFRPPDAMRVVCIVLKRGTRFKRCRKKPQSRLFVSFRKRNVSINRFNSDGLGENRSSDRRSSIGSPIACGKKKSCSPLRW